MQEVLQKPEGVNSCGRENTPVQWREKDLGENSSEGKKWK